MPRKAKAPKIEAGDTVLLGGTRASFPSGWCLGVVLWSDGRDILVERGGGASATWREVVHTSQVRAVGPSEDLVRIKNRAADEVRELVRAAGECESALGRARDAVWAKLDELAEGGLEVIPPDFDEIEAARDETRAAIEAEEAANPA